jgi:hypothetical protein
MFEHDLFHWKPLQNYELRIVNFSSLLKSITLLRKKSADVGKFPSNRYLEPGDYLLILLIQISYKIFLVV